jgi:hypothetical protein
MLGSIARRSVVLSSRRSATKTRELRNLRRARRGPASTSARAPTRSVSVSHPTLKQRGGSWGGWAPTRRAASTTAGTRARYACTQ